MNAVELAQKSRTLFTLPDVYMRLQSVVNKPETKLDNIAELISTDAALTARLLKIANSSFYNFPAQIDSIARAINLIGTNQLMNLVLATSVANSFSGIPEELVDMDSFWRHNVDTGLVARSLGAAAKQRDVERLFVIGLLHNVGKLVVLNEMPEQAMQVLQPEADQLPCELQQQVLGFTFAECGAELLSLWELPDALVECVRHQNAPRAAANETASSALLHIASHAASAMEQEICPEQGPNYRQLIDADAWQLANVDGRDLDAAVEFAQEEAWNMLAVISPAEY